MLYEVITKKCSLQRMNCGIPRIVITSYSIHYTKLYDVHFRADQPVDDIADGAAEVVAGADTGDRRVGQYDPGRLDDRVGFAAFGKRQAVGRLVRITSYNVCYTKLLREGY